MSTRVPSGATIWGTALGFSVAEFNRVVRRFDANNRTDALHLDDTREMDARRFCVKGMFCRRTEGGPNLGQTLS
jgi:hypothetical protein